MARVRAFVRHGMLRSYDGGNEQELLVGGSAWEGWLDQPGSKAFRFDDGAGSFTARRELQRGRPYWYAYRRDNGRLAKAYLGRAGDLTLERLEEVRAHLDAVAAVATSPASDAVLHAAAARTSGPIRHNLRGEVSAFLGRHEAIDAVRHLLLTNRLVTLTGTGGVGKSRLALQVAGGVLGTSDAAVWLVELAALSDGALAPRAVAQALGVREQPGRPLIETVATALAAGPVLVVLDNCEHLVDACARVATTLLRACPAARILATSRMPLGIPGEVAWRVPSLGLPDDEEPAALEWLAQTEAVRLFVARAQAMQPAFALTEANAPAVAEVCRRLDGIPLAIELAAARVPMLSPEELVCRLDDRFRLLTGGNRVAPPRQQTLQAAIDWSYDLLTAEDRRLFERLSVFAGGFTLDAAEAIAAGQVERPLVLDQLSRLVDQSLVTAEPEPGTATTRYRMLETLRAYAAGRLEARHETEAVREQHARWITGLAQQAERAFQGPEQGRWLRWAEREHDNASAALAWAVERQESDLATRLAAAFSWPWLLQGRWSEGLDWAESVLALPHAAPTRARGMLLVGAIQLACFRGDLTSNRPSGDLGAVIGRVKECLVLGETLPDEYLVQAGHGLLGLLLENGVELEGIQLVSQEDELAALRRLGHAWGHCRALEAMARHALRRGDLDAAGALLQEAVEVARRAEDTWSLAMALNELGDIERARGRHPRAGALYEESLARFGELGLGGQPTIVHNLGYVALAAGDCRAAAARFGEALGQFRRLGERRAMAECLIGLGVVAAAMDRPAAAGKLAGAGEAALAAAEIQPWAVNHPDAARWFPRVQRGRSASTFARARAEGRQLSLEQATIWALEQEAACWSAPRTAHAGEQLTAREREVAMLAARGLTNRQIAEALAIAEKTSANHLQRVLDKLEVATRTQLAVRAAEFGLAPAEGASSSVTASH